jgi:hypothetical protein
VAAQQRPQATEERGSCEQGMTSGRSRWEEREQDLACPGIALVDRHFSAVFDPSDGPNQLILLIFTNLAYQLNIAKLQGLHSHSGNAISSRIFET